MPLENVMTNLRKVKDDHEIDLIRKAVQVAEEAFKAIEAEIKVGQTEGYLAGLLIMELRSRGASDASFPPIVAAGAEQFAAALSSRRDAGAARSAAAV